MKKNVFSRALAAIAVSAMALSASAISASAAEDEHLASYGFTADEISASEVKATITIDTVELTLDEAKANPTQEVKVNVAGADGKYATLGLYFCYDSRLTLVPDSDAEPVCVETAFLKVAGEQKDLGEGSYSYAGDDVLGAFSKSGKWVYLNGAASSNKGKDGEALTFKLTLPSDVAAGDFYPVELVYRSSDSIVSRFTDASNTETGKKMQAYLFTQGITNGGIQIKDEETTTSTSTTTTTTTTTTTSTAAAETSSTTSAAAASTTTAKATTTAAKATTTAKPTDAPKTGVAGVGVAVAGLAVAVGTAFVLRKKED
ncbi:MAG: NPXTG-anchored protein [Ruminococcus sp.]|nr:NPXTG-anchored protein [Ruminococcus sp.]